MLEKSLQVTLSVLACFEMHNLENTVDKKKKKKKKKKVAYSFVNETMNQLAYVGQKQYEKS